MKNTFLTIKRVVKLTRKHIRRNRWLSLASILVIFFSFLISTLFLVMGLGSNKGLDALEKQGQILVFFELDTPQEEIDLVKNKVAATGLTENIIYISQEEAQKIYIQDFENDVELVESVTTGALPPSLEIRAKDLDNVEELLKVITKEKEDNKNINEIVYYKEFIQRLKAAVTLLRFAGLGLIIFLAIVSVILIFITIGFNIKAHSDEVKTMKLIGSTSTFIRMPYILEGALYGTIGAVLAALVLLGIWFGGLYLIKQTDFYFLMTQMLRELSLLSLIRFRWETLLLLLGIEALAGIIVGAGSSLVAVLRYMKSDI